MDDWVVALGFPFHSLVSGVGVEGKGEVVVIDWVGRIIVWFVGVFGFVDGNVGCVLCHTEDYLRVVLIELFGLGMMMARVVE